MTADPVLRHLCARLVQTVRAQHPVPSAHGDLQLLDLFHRVVVPRQRPHRYRLPRSKGGDWERWSRLLRLMPAGMP